MRSATCILHQKNLKHLRLLAVGRDRWEANIRLIGYKVVGVRAFFKENFDYGHQERLHYSFQGVEQVCECHKSNPRHGRSQAVTQFNQVTDDILKKVAVLKHDALVVLTDLPQDVARFELIDPVWAEDALLLIDGLFVHLLGFVEGLKVLAGDVDYLAWLREESRVLTFLC